MSGRELENGRNRLPTLTHLWVELGCNDLLCHCTFLAFDSIGYSSIDYDDGTIALTSRHRNLILVASASRWAFIFESF